MKKVRDKEKWGVWEVEGNGNLEGSGGVEGVEMGLVSVSGGEGLGGVEEVRREYEG